MVCSTAAAPPLVVWLYLNPDSKCVTTVKGRIQSFLFIPECILICFAEKYICRGERGGGGGFYLCFVCVCLWAYRHLYYGIPGSGLVAKELFLGKRATLIWQTSLTAAVDLPVKQLAKEKKGTAAAFLIKSGQWSFHYHVGCFCLTKILRVLV